MSTKKRNQKYVKANRPQRKKIALKKPKKYISKKTHKSSTYIVSRWFKKLPSMSVVLIVLVLIIVIFTLRFMYDSKIAANKAYDAANVSADSFLAYSKEQIKVAGIVGDKKQLQREISGFQGAPEDLQNYVLKDYKQFKKSCVVNGALVGKTSYELISIVYDRFALVAKDCNGKQQNIISKINGKWVVVDSGNVTIKCTLVNDFDIPQGISRNCIENGVEYLNPNP